MSESTPKAGLSANFSLKRFTIMMVAFAISLSICFVPLESFGIEGLNTVQRRVIAVFVLATLLWLTESLPAWATSVIIIALLLLSCSDSSFLNLREGVAKEELLKYKDIMACFADPIIILFIGGFVLAIAASKSGLDAVLARVMLRPFGTKSNYVLLGFLLITGVFSMFISNTATAAMMLTFLAPVFKALPDDPNGRVALTLSIPVAANLGGMGTPIGTPPNMIALKYLNDPNGLNLNIGFGEWMMFMMPFTLIMLTIGWLLLIKFFPFKQQTIHLHIDGEAAQGWRTKATAIIFIITVAMWVLDKFTGVNANTVAILPIAAFALTGVIRKKDLEDINWSVIWMVAGGFALGLALNQSGLAKAAINSIPFNTWSPVTILLISGLICYLLSNFISNTATAALLVPILAVVCTGMGDLIDSIGGTTTVLVGIAIAASTAMSLPISTPPNAIAHSTGLVTQQQMLKTGLTVGIIGMTLGYLMLYFVGELHLLG